MKAGDRVVFIDRTKWLNPCFIVSVSCGESTCMVSMLLEDSDLKAGTREVETKDLSLIDDKPSALPFTTAAEYLAGITPLTNEEIDKLGRGLSDD